jgi:transposase
MFIEVVQNNGKKYLRLVQSNRVVNKDGLKVSQKKVIKNIGPLDRYDDGAPDYVERLKNSFKAGVPLIPELKEYCENKPQLENYRFTIREGSPECFGHPKHYSHILLERIIEEIGLRNFFASYKGFTKLEYDVYGFAKLLIFGRFLNPGSKIATVRQNKEYYEPILENYNEDNVYDTLSFIAENKEKIIRRINTNLVKKAGRTPEIIYYDVTNFYFEKEDPDEDIVDEEGNVVETGQRKYGYSKEERNQPIVQMGLFMDNEGIPISIETYPGNTLDHLTLIPSLKKNIDGLNYTRFILIADRGMCSYKNLLHVMDEGNGYIVSKSLLKCPKPEREWAYDSEGYIKVGEDFKYKSRIVKRTVKDEKGNTRQVEEKVVVYWSKKFEECTKKENKRFFEFMKKLEKTPANFRITTIESKAIRKFMKKEYVNTKTGELLNASDIKGYIDFDKVADFKKGMGYYQIVTSELKMDAKTVIDKYHGLTQIEDQFRVMKSDLQARPIYVRTPDHVNAHLLICLITLILMRIIQKRIKDHDKKKKDVFWYEGLSCERIQAAMNKWKVDMLPEDYYRFMDIDDPDLSIILNAFGINIPPKLYRRAELKSIKTGINIFM